MKTILPITILLSMLFYTCSTDLDVTADWEEIPVVYGLLNKVDSVQYIKVNKGYLDNTTSALVIAQIADSIYYQDSIIVKLEVNGQQHILEKIEAEIKESGIFVDSPNYVYRFSQPIQETQEYKLIIENKTSGKTITSKTPIVRDFQINRPPTDASNFEVNWVAASPFNVQWKSAVNGRIYDLVIQFTYTEWNINTPNDIDTLTLDWVIFTNKTSTGTGGGEDMVFPIDGKSFYTHLRSQLAANPQIQRKAIAAPLSFLFYVGGEELYNYIRINRAQTGITQLQVKPEYTNIDGGLGIFSSRYNKSREGVKINGISLDSLSCGSITANLNFVNRVCN